MARAKALTAAAAASAPPWDLVVIGAGAAGLVASRAAGGFGARVLLIERGDFGGECLWTGCIPSKALLAAAHIAHDAVSSAHLGVTAEVDVDFSRVMAHVREAITAIEPEDSPEAAHADGVHTLRGAATFTGPRQLSVGDSTVQFRHAVIATGAEPLVPSIEGLDTAGALTTATFWTLTAQPDRLLIVGGGAVGCELGQAMARLGTEVTIIERGGRLLRREDAATAALIRSVLEDDGVRVHTGATVRRFTSANDAVLTDGTPLAFDRVLVAVGSQVHSDGLDVGAAGILVDSHGRIIVDASLRTSNSAVSAAGDVTTLPHFTHSAGMAGSVAGTNAILGLRRRGPWTNVPRVLYTQPEVAAVGISPEDAERTGCHILEVDHAHLDRAIAEGRTIGSTRLVVDRAGKICGAVVVGPRAGEVIIEVLLAMRTRTTAGALGGLLHPYPGHGDSIYNAGLRELQRTYSSGILGAVVQVLRRATKARRRARER